MITLSPIPLYPPHELLQELFDSLNEIVCALDTSGRFVYINNASAVLWGYERDELIGKLCFDFMVPEDREHSIRATVAGGAKIPTFENRYYRKDGSIAYMSWEGVWDTKHQLIYGTGRDITEVKLLELIEQQHREEFKRLLDRITDGFIGLDEDARVTYWNKAAESITLIPQQEVIGKVIWDVMVEPAVSEYKSYYESAKRSLHPINVEHYSKRIQRWIEVSTYVSGSGLSIFFRDITEQKKLREQLLHEKEQQQKRITAAVIKATEDERAFVGKELHDNVNQVLTTVKLYTELCLTDFDKKEDLLKRSTQLLQESINEIRGLSKRLSAPSLGNIRLKDSVKELVDAINATNRLQVSYEHNIEEVETTEDVHIAIYRVLQEHFTNIIKHAKATNVSVRITLVDHTLKVIVQDNGQGFDPAKYRKGIGVENMISRTENLGGELQLISAPNQGCTLQLLLPLNNA